MQRMKLGKLIGVRLQKVLSARLTNAVFQKDMEPVQVSSRRVMA